MEKYINKHLRTFRSNLDNHADAGDVFDLKELVAFFVLDVLGELAFSRSFDAQIDKNPGKLPPINDHIYLACLMGMMPEMMPFLKMLAAWTPLPWFQSLFQARRRLRELTSDCVEQRISQKLDGRSDLLGSLINAADPETGAKLTALDIKTEAFAML
jgi:benzoate 4-monooxygenase